MRHTTTSKASPCSRALLWGLAVIDFGFPVKCKVHGRPSWCKVLKLQAPMRPRPCKSTRWEAHSGPNGPAWRMLEDPLERAGDRDKSQSQRPPSAPFSDEFPTLAVSRATRLKEHRINAQDSNIGPRRKATQNKQRSVRGQRKRRSCIASSTLWRGGEQQESATSRCWPGPFTIQRSRLKSLWLPSTSAVRGRRS